MKKMKLKINVFYKYFITYILVLSFPLIIMGGVMYYNSNIVLKKEIENSNLNKLEQLQQNIDIQMKQLSYISARIAANSRLTKFVLDSGPLNVKDAIEELKNYKINDTIVEDLFLYYKGDNQIYSTQGTYSIDDLLKYVYKYNEWDKQSFFQDINSNNVCTIRPSEKVNINNQELTNVLTCFYPIPPQNYYSNGTVMFIIRESMMKNLMADILGDTNGNIYILDDKNRVLACDTKVSSIDIRDINAKEYNKTGIFNIKIKNVEYSLIVAKSTYINWSYITIIPTRQFLSRVIETKSIIFLLILLILIIGIYFAYKFSQLNYLPIKTLIKHIGNNLPTGFYKDIDEFNIINSAMTTAEDNNKNLSQIIETQRPIFREQILFDILRGTTKEEEEIHRRLQIGLIDMKYSDFFVLCLSLSVYSNLTPFVRKSLFELLSEISLDGCTVYGVELTQDNIAALIVNFENIGDINVKEKRLATAKQITDLLKTKFDFENTYIGIGRECNRINDINHSFNEALIALKYKISRNVNYIFYEEVIQSTHGNYQYPVDQKLKLIQSIKYGDKILSLEVIEDIMDFITTRNEPFTFLRLMCLDIVNTLVKTMNEINLDIFSNEIIKLAEFSNIEEFKQNLIKIVNEMCEYIRENKESKNKVLCDKIISYIQKHYCDYDLELGNIAAQFNLSPSYLCRFFKDQTGYSFVDYTTLLRINEVKNQLVSSDKSVKEIVSSVGYIDAATFTRKFKKIEGITPIEYRNMFKK